MQSIPLTRMDTTRACLNVPAYLKPTTNQGMNMASFEKFHSLVFDAATAGQKRAFEMVRAGIMPCFYLYYRPSKDGDGALILLDDNDAVPDGWVLATGESLKCNVPYSHYWEWVRKRSMSLPILGAS
jgi:hypothetical protein